LFGTKSLVLIYLADGKRTACELWHEIGSESIKIRSVGRIPNCAKSFVARDGAEEAIKGYVAPEIEWLETAKQ
jgi:hypothetical protein